VEARQAGEIPDVLLLLEHEPTITLGRRGDESNIFASEATLRREGITVRRAERGGDVTYHGPGQLVGYPIVHLPSHRLGASDYMHALEDVLMQVLDTYGVRTHRRQGIIGVWVGENKIAALGVRIRRGVTFHGLALNVCPEMRHWEHIVPCGITDGGVTSLARELASLDPPRRAPTLAEVGGRVALALAQRLQVSLAPSTLAELGIAPGCPAEDQR